MKVRDRLKPRIRKGLLLSLLFIFFAVISLNWFKPMPQIFVFLVGGAILFLAEAVLLWTVYRKADPFVDEIVAELVKVREINESHIAIEGLDPVFWSDMDEIRKVYRSVGSFAVIPGPRMSPAATRRFFYVIHLRDGKWLQLSNVSVMAYRGSIREGLAKASDAVNLVKQLLTEAGRQPHIRLVCHNEAVGRFETLDVLKEMEALSNWDKKQ